MILFFDACSSAGYIGLYTMQREYIASQEFHIAGSESSKIISIIEQFLAQQAIKYGSIEHIICVRGPGSFTGLRTISLVINSIAYMFPHISLTPVIFFDLFDSYPIVKSSSKRDLFVKYEKSDIIHIVQNSDFEKYFTGKNIFGDVDVSRFSQKYISHNYIDYNTICKNIVLQNHKKISPLYIKKANIS